MTASNAVEKADKAFETFLILLGIFQATLFSFILGGLNPNNEILTGIAFLVVFTTPFLIALGFWIRVILEQSITERTILYRFVSWNALIAGFLVFSAVFVIFAALKVVLLNVYIAIGVMLVLFLVLSILYVPEKRIIQIYRTGTPHLRMWSMGHRPEIYWTALFVFFVGLYLSALYFLR